jgi:hypothetical protein
MTKPKKVVTKPLKQSTKPKIMVKDKNGVVYVGRFSNNYEAVVDGKG